MRSRSASAMPGPASTTSTTSLAPVVFTRTMTRPWRGLWRRALSSRLVNSRCRGSASAVTGRASRAAGASRSRRMPRWAARSRWLSSRSSSSSSRSKRRRRARPGSSPCSWRARNSRSLSRAPIWAARRSTWASKRRLAGSVESGAAASRVRRLVSGWRSSWEASPLNRCRASTCCCRGAKAA